MNRSCFLLFIENLLMFYNQERHRPLKWAETPALMLKSSFQVDFMQWEAPHSIPLGDRHEYASMY